MSSYCGRCVCQFRQMTWDELNSDAAEELADLIRVLDGLPPGAIQGDDLVRVRSLLAACWHLFGGHDETKMEAYKLERMEQVTWCKPELSLVIERHGGTKGGSSRAELQQWLVNLETRQIHRSESRIRQLRKAAPRLDIAELVGRLVATIESGGPPPSWLRRDGTDSNSVQIVVIVVSKIPELTVGPDKPKKTIEGRRKRFRAALTEILEKRGWVEVGNYRFQRQRAC